MPSFDDRSDSRFDSIPMPGLKRPMPSSGPLPGQEKSTQSLAVPENIQDTSVGQSSPFSSTTTGQLLQTNPAVTRVLTATLPRVSENTTSQRIPVVIKGDMKKLAAAPLTRSAHRKRRLVVNLLGVFILISITALTLALVSPLGHDISLSFNPQQTGSNIVANQNPTLNHLVAQATATAVFHQQTDGYVPSTGGGQTTTNGSGSLNWPVGQCTYWANSRYHALSGHWVSWSGNADQWVAGARSAGWNVSQTPHVPSIIVLMPGVQGASSYGHVAVVESASGNTVHTSNMNWYSNGGGWDIVSYFDFTTGSGVYFVWK